MNTRKHRVVNARSAVHCIVYAPEKVEQRMPEFAKDEIMEPLPRKVRLPGTLLLKKLAKNKEKLKAKREAEHIGKAGINEDAVQEALTGIFADLES